MLYLLNEGGNSELKNRRFPIPKGVRKYLTKTLEGYNGDKTIDGYKRLNNLLSNDAITYQEMKRIKNYFDTYKGPDNSAEYILNGGDVMQTWVNNTLGNATKAIKDYKQTMKDAGMPNMFIRSHEKNRQIKKKNKPTQVKVQTNNASKSIANNNSLRYESLIRESGDWHVYYDYVTDYDTRYVFDEFLSNPNGRQNWAPTINPSMYTKALEEFTRFGKLEKFPTKYVYQWMGIIMKNTAILRANTSIAGHDQWFPTEEFDDFVESWCGDNLIEYDNYEDFTIRKENGEEIHYDNPYDFLYECGMLDYWMVLPDGSDAWSDYGLGPIEKLIAEYDENKPAEQVLVLVNKILDVYHQRGDIASAFVQGGHKALTQASNGLGSVKENRCQKNLIITEEQRQFLIRYFK